MIRAAVKLVLLVVVVVAVGAFVLGWWGRSRSHTDRSVVPTAGVEAPEINRDRARELGAKVGERTAAATSEAQRALAEGSLTAKIKAKMALDDTVKALNIDVDTSGTTVTLSGVVSTQEERERALRLARETDGVTQVVDRLELRR